MHSRERELQRCSTKFIDNVIKKKSCIIFFLDNLFELTHVLALLNGVRKTCLVAMLIYTQ